MAYGPFTDSHEHTPLIQQNRKTYSTYSTLRLKLPAINYAKPPQPHAAPIRAFPHEQFPRLSSVQQEWAYNFLAQGSSGILNCWVKNNMEEPPRTVAAFIGQLFSLLMNEFDGK
jgi:hypothetical protein